MANATNQNTNANEVKKGTFAEPILCIQCKEYSFIEGVCSDGCNSDVDLELHTEHYLGGFDSQDCPCSECSAKQETVDPNWKVYEVDEIGSASVVRDLSKHMMSVNVSPLDAALTADRYGDRPVVKMSEIEYLALLDRSTLTESYLDADLIDDFEELDKLNNKQIKSELGVDTSFTQIHFRNANGR